MELQVSTMTLCPPKPPFALSSFTAAFAPWVSSVSESAPGIEYEINENLTGDFALAPLLLPVLAMAATPDAQARAATTSPAVACFRRIFSALLPQWQEVVAGSRGDSTTSGAAEPDDRLSEFVVSYDGRQTRMTPAQEPRCPSTSGSPEPQRVRRCRRVIRQPSGVRRTRLSYRAPTMYIGVSPNASVPRGQCCAIRRHE